MKKNWFKDDIRRANFNPVEQEESLRLFTVGYEAFIGKTRIIPPASERCMEDAPSNTIFLTIATEK